MQNGVTGVKERPPAAAVPLRKQTLGSAKGDEATHATPKSKRGNNEPCCRVLLPEFDSDSATH